MGIRPTKAFQAPTTELNLVSKRNQWLRIRHVLLSDSIRTSIPFRPGMIIGSFHLGEVDGIQFRDAESQQRNLKYILHIHQHPTFTR